MRLRSNSAVTIRGRSTNYSAAPLHPVSISRGGISVAYGAGLRAMEVVALKVSDVDSKRMTLRVEQGKGGKDRFAMLSPQLLELLRDWWRIARPAVWMFPGRDRISP
jgi:integrase/recombinase XerD